MPNERLRFGVLLVDTFFTDAFLGLFFAGVLRATLGDSSLALMRVTLVLSWFFATSVCSPN